MDSEDEANLSAGASELLFKWQQQHGSERRILREKYQELIKVALREKENEEFIVDNIIQNMNEADELFKEVCRAREAMFDAKLLNIHSEIAKKKAHSIQAGSAFNSISFMRKLAVELTGKYADSDDVDLDEEAWLKLGNRVFRVFNRTPKLNFIQGMFLEPVETVKQQRRIKSKDSKSKTSEPKVVDAETQNVNSDKTYEEIQRIKKILHILCKRKGGPICYFSFTIDPDSFSRTIENMFHLAFLIKEHEVLLSVDRNELPVIEPVISGRGSTTQSDTAQSVLTMSVEKWKQLIEVFEIKKSAIPLASSYRLGVS